MSDPLEKRALKACRDYFFWKEEIKRLGVDIGGNLSLCPDNSDDGSRTTHLSKAYEGIKEYNGVYYENTYMDHDEVVGYLAEEGCKYCLQAHMLVQQRKYAKKKFGAAKRFVGNIGKEAK